MSEKWIGVDFDGTLATYSKQQGTGLGEPIPLMVERVKRWLAGGIEVRVVTARVSSRNETNRLKNGEDMWEAGADRAAIEPWCEQNIGQKIHVTAEKVYAMKELWDDGAVSVEF